MNRFRLTLERQSKVFMDRLDHSFGFIPSLVINFGESVSPAVSSQISTSRPITQLRAV